jgi:glycine amidinotransferase
MTKIVNSWNEWDPLKRVIMGRPEGSNISGPEPAWQVDNPTGGYPLGTWGPMPQEMVDRANEQMANYKAVLEKRGIIVEQIDIMPFMLNQPLPSPLGWTHPNAYGVNNVRDATMIHGNKIIEATMSRRSRVYERFNLRPIFEGYLDEDPEAVFFSAPFPMLTDESFNRNYNYHYDNVWTDEEKREKLYNLEWQLTEKEALWDAADGMRFGKDIFHQASCLTNRKGMKWLRNMFAEFGIRYHACQFDSPYDYSLPGATDNFHPWHIDVNLLPVRPGLCFTNPDWSPRNPELRRLFEINDWELVEAVRPTYKHQNACTMVGHYDGFSWISMNCLSLDPKTICVEAKETAFCEQLDKYGLEVIPIDYEAVFPFGGSFHCTTLDVYREGVCEDYFPKQIPGY